MASHASPVNTQAIPIRAGPRFGTFPADILVSSVINRLMNEFKEEGLKYGYNMPRGRDVTAENSTDKHSKLAIRGVFYSLAMALVTEQIDYSTGKRKQANKTYSGWQRVSYQYREGDKRGLAAPCTDSPYHGSFFCVS